MPVESDYEDGRCQDCGFKIQPYGPSGRCEDCNYQFTAYIYSGWGLDKLVKERGQNQIMGLCFYCGSGLESPADRLCLECQMKTENGQWCQSQYRKGRKVTSDRNPYNNVWDSNEVDNAVHLDATYGTIAEQMLAKAKYYKQKAERKGPRGREYLEDARCYIRIAHKMLEREKDVRRKCR